MKRIGLTQRVEIIASYNERRDCLDQRWAPLLLSLSLMPIPLSNGITDVQGYLSEMRLDGVIFTGGNDLSHVDGAQNPAPERDSFEREVMKIARDHAMPILGVCRGMQFMGDFYGSKLTAINNHVAVRHQVFLTEPFMDWTKEFEVNSYHNQGFQRSTFNNIRLHPLAIAQDSTIEAFRHKDLPHYGIMWHPEREKQYSARDSRLIMEIFKSS